jgi:hypothetical protein
VWGKVGEWVGHTKWVTGIHTVGGWVCRLGVWVMQGGWVGYALGEICRVGGGWDMQDWCGRCAGWMGGIYRMGGWDMQDKCGICRVGRWDAQVVVT